MLGIFPLVFNKRMHVFEISAGNLKFSSQNSNDVTILFDFPNSNTQKHTHTVCCTANFAFGKYMYVGLFICFSTSSVFLFPFECCSAIRSQVVAFESAYIPLAGFKLNVFGSNSDIST